MRRMWFVVPPIIDTHVKKGLLANMFGNEELVKPFICVEIAIVRSSFLQMKHNKIRIAYKYMNFAYVLITSLHEIYFSSRSHWAGESCIDKIGYTFIDRIPQS